MAVSPSVIDTLVTQLDLQPHPEGGLYRRTNSSEERIFRSDANRPHHQRHASTAIYYMLRDSDYSAWHRIDSDELWHFHLGDPLFIHVLNPQGELSTQVLGNPLEHPDGAFQVHVFADHWFAAERIGQCGFSLVGCTVAPGFEFETFELADVPRLQQQYPRHQALLARLAPRKPAPPDENTPRNGSR